MREVLPTPESPIATILTKHFFSIAGARLVAEVVDPIPLEISDLGLSNPVNSSFFCSSSFKSYFYSVFSSSIASSKLLPPSKGSIF